MKKMSEVVKSTYFEGEGEQKKMVVIMAETEEDLGKNLEAEILYSVWTGTKEIELQRMIDWNLGVKLNSEQAEESQKNNFRSWFPTDIDKGVEVVTEGYYIVEQDRGGDWYYKVNNERDLVTVLLNYYTNCLDMEFEYY